MKRTFLLESLFIMCMFCSLIAVAKPFSLGGGDNQRGRMAEKYFLAKNYEKATPLFAQLVSNHPNNFKYNYYYGTCLLITGKDKGKAVHYLESALKKPKTPYEVYYYLGKAYHLNYMFEEGIRAFKEFNAIIKPKHREKWNANEPMEWCYNGKRILDQSKDSVILEKTEKPAAEFYSKYMFTSNCGKMLSMPEEYRTKDMDGENPMVFLSANARVMYFAAYNKETSSRDIYRVDKQADGNWAQPEVLSASVNTKSDELMPTCSADGKVLYFSSKGHQTTGGFDLYKSVLSMADKTWSPAENMASPYSSPFDDFCFVSSPDDKIAYFVSSRESEINNMTVCKAGYDGTQLPVEIKGKFSCIGQPDLKEIQLTIRLSENDSVVAYLNTDAKTGEYNVMLPGPGTYKFKVEANGYKPIEQTVTFSEFGENYYVQEIFLSRNVDGTEDMAINNLKINDNWMENATASSDPDNENNITMADINAKEKNLSEEERAKLNTAINNSNLTNGINGEGYRVQIGAFCRQSDDVTKQHLAKKTKQNFYGIKEGKWSRYFIGRIATMKEARELKAILRKAGFRDAYVVAFNPSQQATPQKAVSTETEQQ